MRDCQILTVLVIPSGPDTRLVVTDQPTFGEPMTYDKVIDLATEALTMIRADDKRQVSVSKTWGTIVEENQRAPEKSVAENGLEWQWIESARNMAPAKVQEAAHESDCDSWRSGNSKSDVDGN